MLGEGIIKKLIVILSALLIGVLASPVEAHHKQGHDKGGGNKAVILTIVETAPYTFGNQISIVGGEDGQWVRNECRQGGQLVYAQYQKVIGGISGPFTLGPTPSWSDGAADCTAFLNTKFIERIKKTDIFYEVSP